MQFTFPDPGDLSITVDIGSKKHPYVIAFTHGHAYSSPDRALDRWEDQAFGRQKAGDADMLVSAHFHHYRNRLRGQAAHLAADPGPGWRV